MELIEECLRRLVQRGDSSMVSNQQMYFVSNP